MTEITAQELYDRFMVATTLPGKRYLPFNELPNPAKLGWESVAVAVTVYIHNMFKGVTT